jgi:alkanesulfonate monooxygenase SsuD/methylene tetrahydromethanopterin reductase-like flavin-dependent oxidoreductase (luciferase family)
VECWQPIQGGTQRALDFMATHGIKGIIGGGVAEGGAMDDIMMGYRDALIRAGRVDPKPGEGLSVGFQFYIAETCEKAIQAAKGYYEENLKMFGPLRLTRGLSEEQILQISDPNIAPHAGLPTLEEAVNAGSFLCGPPDEIIASLKNVEERYPGLDRVSIGQPVGTPQNVILEQLEMFAKEVMPAFKGRVEAQVPAD